VPTKPRALEAAALRSLAKLCAAVSVSGDEREVRKIVQDELKSHADDLKVDALGNVLVTRKGRAGRRLRVMLDAHMDEVGFMLVNEDGEGLYEFKTIGGIDARNLAGKQVAVGTEHTPGVIGARPIHLTKSDELKHAISVDSLRIDIGLPQLPPGGTIPDVQVPR
jgi:tetrahedral aminopeptidase